jgi:acetate kinase
MGIHLDPRRNEMAVGGRGEEFITTDDSPVKVLVIPTNEALVIAEDTLVILAGS